MSVTYPSAPPHRSGALRRRGRLTSARSLLKVLAGAGVLAALLVAIAALMKSHRAARSRSSQHAPGGAKTSEAAAAAPAAPTLAQAKGVAVRAVRARGPEPARRPDGQAVKRFDVDVYHHVTQVTKDLAPTEIWSYKVNGIEHRGTGYSEAMVVELGDDGRLQLHQRLRRAHEGHAPALDGLPLRRGQPRQALRRPRPGQEHALPLHRQPPGRVHVPLRHAADPDAHRHGHGRRDDRQAQGPRSRRAICSSTSRSTTSASPARRPTWTRSRPRRPT